MELHNTILHTSVIFHFLNFIDEKCQTRRVIASHLTFFSFSRETKRTSVILRFLETDFRTPKIIKRKEHIHNVIHTSVIFCFLNFIIEKKMNAGSNAQSCPYISFLFGKKSPVKKRAMTDDKLPYCIICILLTSSLLSAAWSLVNTCGP